MEYIAYALVIIAAIIYLINREWLLHLKQQKVDINAHINLQLGLLDSRLHAVEDKTSKLVLGSSFQVKK